MSSEVYKILGPISVVQLWLCLWFMIKKWPGNKTMSYSAHAAATKAGIIYYLASFSLHLVLFYIFALKWFAPTYGLPSIFLVILFIAELGQLGALLIPSTGGRMTLAHDITAYLMHILLMPLSLFIVFSNNFSMFARLVAVIATSYMVFVWLTFIKGKLNDRHLLLQTIYGLSFHVAILVAAFL
ncbi:MAG: hypothetical protein AAB459_00880 [Patescibacteria group bacterium]